MITLNDELMIGRAESGEGRLGNDPELSRRHARVPGRPGSLEHRGSGIRERHVHEWRAHQRAPGAPSGRRGARRPYDPGLTAAPARQHRRRRRPPRLCPVLPRPRRRLPPRPHLRARLRRGLRHPRLRLRPPLRSRRQVRPRHDRLRPHPRRASARLRHCGLPGRRGHRVWRHGGGLPGGGARAPAAGCPGKVIRPEHSGGRSLPRALPARVEDRCVDRSPQRDPDPRRGEERRCSISACASSTAPTCAR